MNQQCEQTAQVSRDDFGGCCGAKAAEPTPAFVGGLNSNLSPGLDQSIVAALRKSATDVSTPEVTVSLEEFNRILDGIATFNNITLRQKKAVEDRLVSTRNQSVDFIERADRRIRDLEHQLATARGTVEFNSFIHNVSEDNATRYIQSQAAQITDLQKQLRKAKRNRGNK